MKWRILTRINIVGKTIVLLTTNLMSIVIAIHQPALNLFWICCFLAFHFIFGCIFKVQLVERYLYLERENE